jgi:hypothetical protein
MKQTYDPWTAVSDFSELYIADIDVSLLPYWTKDDGRKLMLYCVACSTLNTTNKTLPIGQHPHKREKGGYPESRSTDEHPMLQVKFN